MSKETNGQGKAAGKALMTISEVAEALGISRYLARTIFKGLERVKIGKKEYIYKKDLLKKYSRLISEVQEANNS